MDALIDCPLHQSHFQKIIGYYPLTSSSTINWANLRAYTSPLECLKQCQEDPNCSGFIYHIIENKCNGVDLRPHLNEAVDNKKLVHDPTIIFYEKACLNRKFIRIRPSYPAKGHVVILFLRTNYTRQRETDRQAVGK